MIDQIRYKKGYKYQLVEAPSEGKLPFELPAPAECPFVHIDKDGSVLIEPGYAWDGASGIASDTPNFMGPSLWHDMLYQLMRCKQLDQKFRKEADKLLRQMCLNNGMFRLRAAWVYRAVRLGGGPAATVPKPILTAPRG